MAFVLLALAAHRIRVKQLLALQQVRMRIAADLHDDIGGSLSRIAIQSEVACRELSAVAQQPAGRIAEIGGSAREVVDALSDVVWAVDPRRDDLASVFSRLREYGDDVISSSGARWTFTSSGKLAEVRLGPEARRHLFLLLKEALTNIARHASAASVSMRVDLARDELRVELRDDGNGFNPEAVENTEEPRRHGIASMRARADSLGASLRLQSAPGSGTVLALTMKLPGYWRRMTMLLRPRMRR
jgi:signal transduction histidine kinase